MGMLILGVISERPVDELIYRPDKRAMIIQGIVVIHAFHHFPVESVHAAAIPNDAVMDFLTVDECLQFNRNKWAGHGLSFSCQRYRIGSMNVAKPWSKTLHLSQQGCHYLNDDQIIE
jgi:hypothetical protein